jgi:hypothetical protein
VFIGIVLCLILALLAACLFVAIARRACRRRAQGPKTIRRMIPQDCFEEMGRPDLAAAFIADLKAVREAELPKESPAWQRLCADPDLRIGDAGGNCPVQIHVEVDGHQGYFRARGTHWSFEVAKLGHAAPCGDSENLFEISRYYGEWPSAGWMSMSEAAELLEEAIREFRVARLGSA